MIRIYVHIPFCDSKCIYCAFASFVAENGVKNQYFDFLNNEIINSNLDDKVVSSIYFGGGTPSSVEPKQIVRTLETIKNNFYVLSDAEITIECNPCSTSQEKLFSYYKAGFNRISFGVQSLNNSMLKFLSRRHDKRVALQAVKLAKKVGFENISADLILGLKKGNVVRDARALINVGVKHISAYMLQVEEGTRLKALVLDHSDVIKNDDQAVKDYNRLCNFLDNHGFERYEISNFAFNGFQSEHNLGYWRGEKYIGFGLSAHSFDGKNKRWANSSNLGDYYKRKIVQEVLSQEEIDEEKIMLGLRCYLGFNLKDVSFDLENNKNFQQMIKDKILFREEDQVRLNPKYYEISNSIILKLLS